MNKRELRAQLRAQKKLMRQQAAEMKRQVKAQLDANPVVQRARAKRRIRQAAGLSVLLLLLLFIRCDCEKPPATELIAATPDAGVPELVKKIAATPDAGRPPPMRAKIDKQDRGSYHGEANPAPSWLDDFRLQVSARSPRLAECFKGSDRPGALRWTAAVNAESGTVSDHELELIGTGASMGDKQRDCVVAALSKPTYRLSVAKNEMESKPVPNRVSLVIEF